MIIPSSNNQQVHIHTRRVRSRHTCYLRNLIKAICKLCIFIIFILKRFSVYNVNICYSY